MKATGAEAAAGASEVGAQASAAGANAAAREMRGRARRTGSASRTRSIAFVGLTIAIMGVSAWVSVPLGPVLLTLQMFAISFAILVLSPRECMVAITGYVLLGTLGLPLFSGMRGGIGMLLGPTGGYLWGYLLGVGAALALRAALARMAGTRAFAVDLCACLVFIAVSYLCGCVQYAAVVGVDLAAAFAVTIAPFAIPDVMKAVAAVVCARAVKRALPRR